MKPNRFGTFSRQMGGDPSRVGRQDTVFAFSIFGLGRPSFSERVSVDIVVGEHRVHRLPEEGTLIPIGTRRKMKCAKTLPLEDTRRVFQSHIIAIITALPSGVHAARIKASDTYIGMRFTVSLNCGAEDADAFETWVRKACAKD